MSTTLTLSQVKRLAQDRIEALKEQLTKAPLDEVMRLQERVTAFRHLIQWLDAGAQVGIDTPESTAETPGPRGAY